jgi:hypothetical protein
MFAFVTIKYLHHQDHYDVSNKTRQRHDTVIVNFG